MLPAFKHQVTGECAQVVKKALPGAQALTNLLVGRIEQLEKGVEQKSQQIQGQKESSQMLLSMTEIMFQVIALGFEHRSDFRFPSSNVPVLPP